MRIDVITLFPEILRAPLDASILGRAQRGGQAEIVLHQLRDYATDKHRTVDEKPYGGGPGMPSRTCRRSLNGPDASSCFPPRE
jgi:tRNA (guanine37-N1)-methyltransferase